MIGRRGGYGGRVADTVSRTLYSGAGRLIPSYFLGIHSHRWPVGNSYSFTVNTGTNNVVVSHNGRGDVNWINCYLTTTGTLPAPLAVGVKYWCLPVDSGNVKFALERGGAEIDITDSGSGTHTVEFRSPAPTYSYGHFRSWDHIRWAQVHTADDTYDAALLDASLVPHINNGAVISWCAAGTPTWASSNPGGAGLYNLGDKWVPTDVASSTGPLREFLTWLITRYNKASGGLFGTDATRIKAIEVWNEANHTGFWQGSASELAQIAKAIADTVLPIDPNIIIICPGWAANFGGASTLGAYLTASDGAGGMLRDHCDGFAWHPYTYGFDSDEQQLMALTKWAGDIGAEHGIPDLYATEWGYFPCAAGQVVFTPQKRAALMRTIAVQAMLGWKMSTIYSHDNAVAFLTPAADETISAMLHEFHTKVCGKTMVLGQILSPSKRVRMEFSDGSVYTSPS